MQTMKSWVWFHVFLGSVHMALGIWGFSEPTMIEGIKLSSTEIGGFQPYRNTTLGSFTVSDLIFSAVFSTSFELTNHRIK